MFSFSTSTESILTLQSMPKLAVRILHVVDSVYYVMLQSFLSLYELVRCLHLRCVLLCCVPARLSILRLYIEGCNHLRCNVLVSSHSVVH